MNSRIKVLKYTTIVNHLIEGHIIAYNHIYNTTHMKDSNGHTIGAIRFDTLMKLVREKVVVKFNYAYLVDGYMIIEDNIQCIGHLKGTECDKCKYFIKCINGEL